MDALTDRLADIFSSEPQNAAKSAALLLVLYTLTVLPALAWLIASLLHRSKKISGKVTEVHEVEKKEVINLPNAEETALLIKSRRSIFPRDFTDEKVDRKLIERMLDAANWAPTHGKNEPWRFVVLDHAAYEDFVDVMKDALQEVPDLSPGDQERIAAKLEGKKKKQRKVQWAIMICYKRYAGSNEMPEWEELAATSTAVQNLHLMATTLGVSGYWTSSGPEGARDSNRVKSWLGLSQEDRCIGSFLVGKCDNVASYKGSRGPWEEKVTWKESNGKV